MGKAIVLACFPKNAREQVRVALDHWQGHNLVDVRIVVPLASPMDALSPTAKGVALNVALIPLLRQALADAHARAVAMGWLEKGEAEAA